VDITGKVVLTLQIFDTIFADNAAHKVSSRSILAVEAGTGVAIGADTLGHSFGNRVKVLHITPEPKPISVGIVGTKGRLSPAAEKFWQCAKEAASKK
jgi:DNA-binding transcriptional LysR family regulator